MGTGAGPLLGPNALFADNGPVPGVTIDEALLYRTIALLSFASSLWSPVTWGQLQITRIVNFFSLLRSSPPFRDAARL